MLDRFVIKPSRYFVSLLFALHALALVSLWFTNLPVPLQPGLSLLVLLSLLYHLDRQAGKQSWQAFSLDKLRVVVATRNGEELAGSILKQTVVTPCVVLLCVKLDGRRLAVSRILFPDALQADAFRELRVRLRFAQ